MNSIPNKKVSIVILNWNGAEHLKQFLPSVIAHSQYEWCEVVVADNGSTDESLTMLESHFPSVEVIRLNQNFGFAQGYNEALKNIDSTYVVLLNSDVEVTPGWLDPLVQTLDRNSDIGACQPKILQLHHRNHFEYAGACGGFIDFLGYPFCRGRLLESFEEDRGQYDQPMDVFWATGAAFIIRNKLWKDLHGFDGEFWAHMEEIDLCWRMKNQGYRIVAVPQSRVHHLGGGTLSYGNPRKVYLNFRNNLFLIYKNIPKGKLFSTLFMRMVLDGVAGIHFLSTGQWILFTKVLAAHRDFYRALPRLRSQRRVLLSQVIREQHNEIYQGSMIFDYFLRKKHKFSDLIFRNSTL